MAAQPLLYQASPPTHTLPLCPLVTRGRVSPVGKPTNLCAGSLLHPSPPCTDQKAGGCLSVGSIYALSSCDSNGGSSDNNEWTAHVLQIFLKTCPILMSDELLWWVGGEVGERLCNNPPPPTPTEVGLFWFPGFPLILLHSASPTRRESIQSNTRPKQGTNYIKLYCLRQVNLAENLPRATHTKNRVETT